MRLLPWILLAACTSKGGSATSDAPTVADAPSFQLTGTPILATAPLGTSEAVLGTPADKVFQQVNGDAVFAPRTDHTPVDQITIGWVQAESTNQLAANLRGWGLTEADLDVHNMTRYMSMRAYQIDYVEDVDLTMPAHQAPSTAVYFVSKIYFGHSYEALFSGSQSAFTAAVAATLPQAQGSISATAQRDSLMAMNVGRGLVPTSGDAIFAANSADVMANYSAAGPAVPIFIEYRLIPGASEPAGEQIPWTSDTNATISIDELDVFHNGSFLDASNTAWEVTATCSVNGAIVSQDDPVWSSGSVTAGGSHVDPGGSGPQDPNQSDPTSTYGRYAGLPWHKTFPIANGNTLECDLSGARTDKSTPVPLPPVVVREMVDTTMPVDNRTGNYDTGTHLDYQVHYSVTYTAN